MAYAPHGPWKTTTLVVALREDGLTAHMVLDGAMNGKAFLAYVRQVLVPTLQPGDLLFTGTPEGVSPIQAGYRIVATIDKIGSMSVATRADESRSASELSGATAGA